MTELRVTDNTSVKLECGKRFGCGEKRPAVIVGEFGTATPELKGEVVEGVVAVGEGGEDCAVTTRSRIGEEARGLLELFPSGGRSEVAEKLLPECSLICWIVEEIGAIEQALGTVVPGKRTEVAVEDEGLYERARPSIGPVVNVDALIPWVQVFERACGVGFGQPVGDEECEIEMAVLETAVADRGFVELVNSDRDEFDFGSGMTGFEETRFFGECVFKVGIISESDAERTHDGIRP